MKTSVVISTYNGQAYLLDQLKSIRDQTMAVDEVLIADDCSSDNTVAIAKQFIIDNHLDGWHVEVNEHNKGWRRNFMEAMWQSKGDVVFPCDQDDIWRSDKVEKMVQIMEEHPEVNVLTSNYQCFYSDGKTDIGPFKNDGKLGKIDLYTNYMLVKCPGCTYCVRRLVLDWSKKYWQPSYPHDALLWRLGLFSDSLYVIHEDLHHWRMHDDSAFSIESKDLKTISEKQKWIKVAKSINQAMLDFVGDHHFANHDAAVSLLTRYQFWLNLRGKFYDQKNPFTGLHLMAEWKYYPRKRQYLGDWYLIYIKRK